MNADINTKIMIVDMSDKNTACMSAAIKILQDVSRHSAHVLAINSEGIEDMAKALAEACREEVDFEAFDIEVFACEFAEDDLNILENISRGSRERKYSYFNNCASGSASGPDKYPRYPVGFVWPIPR